MGGDQLAKVLAGAGVLLILAGGIVWLLSRAGMRRLPGDIHLEREGYSFSFPIVTCIVISIILTVILNLIRR